VFLLEQSTRDWVLYKEKKFIWLTVLKSEIPDSTVQLGCGWSPVATSPHADGVIGEGFEGKWSMMKTEAEDLQGPSLLSQQPSNSPKN
jgi:hypothetical protein